MTARARAATALVAWALGVVPTEARPDYLVKFEADPMRRADVGGCGACHLKPDGGGARNDFGAAFDAASRDITPLLRANFATHFVVPSAKLPDGTTFFMSDPQSRFVIIERQSQKVLVDVAAIATPTVEPLPAADNRMTFFVSSHGAAAGGHLGGLAGADRLCQDLAKAAGAGDRTWRAYLSTSFKGTPAVHAGDRIGAGPWHNAAGRLVARGPVDLHQKAALPADLALTEKAEAVPPGVPVFTGTLANGTAAVDKTCSNWTLAEGEAAGASAGGAWNAGQTASCGAPSGPAAAPRLYLFALR